MLKRILGLLGWLGVALVFAAFASRNLRPEWSWQPVMITGLVCVLLYILSQWRDIVRDFSGRQARYGSLAIGSILVVLGILVAINYLGQRHNKRWDFTASGQWTLSDQTKKVLQGLTKPIRMTVFARTEDFDRFRNRVEEYQYLTKQLQVEYIDPEKRPSAAERLKESALGTIVLEYEGRVQRVTSDTEQDLTNGLIKVLASTQPKIYFVTGHGEHDINGSDGAGYAGISEELKGDNFVTEGFTLLQQDIPADASVVVVAGPKSDFLEPEIAKLKAFLAKGGKLLVMIDPPQKADAPAPTHLLGLLKDWSVDVGTNAVLDPMSQLRGTQADVPVAAPPYPFHQITSSFRLLTAYPYTRSVKPVEGAPAGRTATSIIMSGRNSWAETDLQMLTTQSKASPEPEKGDVQGPVSIAVAVTAPATEGTPPPATTTDGQAETPNKPETRLVVVGDSDFATNAVAGMGGNRDMFLNMVNWLAQQENLISVRPRNPADRRITLTGGQDRMIFWFSIVILPVLIFLAGVQTWWRRR
jgi:ABC-type uncharacterized transport system involved in gliding motility auxiliary subunit